MVMTQHFILEENIMDKFMEKAINREKREFLRNNGYCFAKDDELPEFNSEEFKFIAKVESDKKLIDMGKDLKVIKKCMIFFTVLTAVSVMFSIFSVMSLINSL